MGEVRHVRVFRNGRSRAVRIPRDFDIFGDELVMRREGDNIVLTPRAPQRSIAEVTAGWVEVEDDVLDPEDRAPEPFDLD